MNLAGWTDMLTQAPWAIYVVVALFATLESVAIIGLVMPGTVMMAMVSSLAGTAGLSMPLVLLSGALGAMLGDGISYWLGFSQSDRMARVWPLKTHPQWLAQGQEFFSRHGALSVLLGRFVGPVRPLVPMIAGMMKMPAYRFMVVNVLSAIGWAPLYILPGYYLGHAWKETYLLSEDTTLWLIQFIFIALLALLSFSWLRNILSRPHRGYRGLLQWSRRFPVARKLWSRAQRFSNRREPPLAAFLLLIVSAVLLVVWSLLVVHHMHTHHPLVIDSRSHKLFNELSRHEWVTECAQLLDLIGDRIGIGALLLPWLVWWLYRRYYAVLLHWLMGAGLLWILATGLKHWVKRSRPFAPDYLAHSWSYPSAHTMAAVVAFGLAAAFVAERLPAYRRNWPFWIATAITLLMGLSRMALSVHWASDVIGGALGGLLVCAAIRTSYPFFARQRLSWMHWRWLLAASLLLLLIRILWVPLH